MIQENEIQIFKKKLFAIQSISEASWNQIKLLATVKEIEKDCFFSKEGENAKYLGLILEGIFRIYYLDEKGNEWNKHFLLKNNFAASSIKPKNKSITNIQALTNVRMIVLPLDAFMELANKHNDLLLFIQKLTFSYLEQKQEREINLLSETAINKYLIFKREFPNLENEIQHFHVASYLGITPTQLSRVRKKIAHQQM